MLRQLYKQNQTNINCVNATKRASEREKKEKRRFSFYLVELIFFYFQVACLLAYTNQMHTMYFGLLTADTCYIACVHFNRLFCGNQFDDCQEDAHTKIYI